MSALESRHAGEYHPVMDKISVELRLLANFVVACQHSKVSAAAAALAHTPSALSTTLHNLEDRLGLRLFERQGATLGLQPAAFWLFRNACQLLQLEAYGRATVHSPQERLNRLVVELDMSLAIGRFSKALVAATQEMSKRHPETFIEWRFSDQQEARLFGDRAEAFFAGGSETVAISYDGREEDGADTVRLAEDPWVINRASGSGTDHSKVAAPITVMRMRPHLLQAVIDYGRQHLADGQLKFVDDEPSRLGYLLQHFPQMRLIMPASMLADRMGLSQLDWQAVEPALVSPLFGRMQRTNCAKAGEFLAVLREELAGEERNVHFEPQMTMRQVQYFNLTCRTGGISAAARAAHVSQSSISAQMQKLEGLAAASLLERKGHGITLLPAGKNLLPLTTLFEERMGWLMQQTSDIAAHTQANIKLGTLPSSGHDSALTAKIARSITNVHAENPSFKLQVSEDSNLVLHEKVRSGELNLAVVGAVQPQVARISLGASEPLSVVANPNLSLPNRQEMSIEEVCGLPLVLGARQLSIHQNFTEAARARKIKIRPVIEVGSLALAIAMVRASWLCTILPASSVQKDVDAGLLVTVPIRRDEIPGSLSIIFSAERSLSDAERIVIRELISAFRPTAPDHPDAP